MQARLIILIEDNLCRSTLYIKFTLFDCLENKMNSVFIAPISTKVETKVQKIIFYY